MNKLRPLLKLVFLFSMVMLPSIGVLGNVAGSPPIASIRLYNPTKSDASSVVEVAVGNLAAPALVDWDNVQLMHNGEPVAFALREGKASWKSTQRTPIKKPRPEDLLVFQISIPTGQWSEVQLVRGRPKSKTTITQRAGVIEVDYPNVKVVIDKESGLLAGLEVYGESVLRQPMRLEFFKLAEGAVKREGAMGSGYSRPVVSLKQKGELSMRRAQMVASSSTAALTELQFVLRAESGPAVGLTYRIFPNQIEILSAERPWEGRSPWLDFGLQYSFGLTGTQEELASFESHFPYYGFKEYAASVTGVGAWHHGTNASILELGEGSINGRIWQRRLAICTKGERTRKEDFVKLMSEGFVVRVIPLAVPLAGDSIQVACPEEFKTIGVSLCQNVNNAGVQASFGSGLGKDAQSSISLDVVKNPSRLGISGDGFLIRPNENHTGIDVMAGTRFGLFQAVQRISDGLRGKTMPLIANNPVVDMRAGGFGGGNFEVDFPYGSEAEWKAVFDNLIASGMNTMTCLGMWGNWKMPIHYKYMPELRSKSPDAYDELSGAKFNEFESYQKQSLKLIHYLQERGVKVWLWIPVGAIPTTFEERYPEATTPKNRKIPRVLHPKYQELLQAYFKEILELYPIDGFMLVRDDNGGIDDTEEYKEYIAASRTKHPVWEQYLLVYDLLRSQGFKGQVAVYPYFDFYEPYLDPLLPSDLLVIGHGSGMGVLSRHFETVGPMGDTWLDNPYSGGFRLPTVSRMKRLLADRSSYWIGGAYCGFELPWEAVGSIGWQPTTSVNSLRYDFGERMFGEKNAVQTVRLSEAYESLWEIMSDWLLPHRWESVSEGERVKVVREGQRRLTVFRQELDRLKTNTDQAAKESWFAHVGLYASFFDYNLRRAELFAQMQRIVVTNRQTTAGGAPLPSSLRQQLIVMHEEIYALARDYDNQAAQVPGSMMAQTRVHKMCMPFKEWVGGYDQSLESVLQVKQFDGHLRISPLTLSCGQPFELEIELHNKGCVPWISGVGHEIELQGDIQELGLPGKWEYEGLPMVFGDKRVVKVGGVAPAEPGVAQLKIVFIAPFRHRYAFLSQSIELAWQ